MNSDSGADGDGYVDTLQGTVNVGDITCRYQVYQIYGAAGDPSIGELYFSCNSTTVRLASLHALFCLFKTLGFM